MYALHWRKRPFQLTQEEAQHPDGAVRHQWKGQEKDWREFALSTYMIAIK